MVQGTTTTACWRNSSTPSDVTTIADPLKPGSLRAGEGVPKAKRTRSPARFGDVTNGRIEHGSIISVEGCTGQLRPDEATALTPDQTIQLRIERQPFTVGQLA